MIQSKRVARRIGAIVLFVVGLLHTAVGGATSADGRSPGEARGQRSSDSAAAPPVPAALTASPRPRLPADLSQAWLVPSRGAVPPRALADFAAAMRHVADAKYAAALPLFSSPALASTPLARYASFYSGLCYLNLARAADARAVFEKLRLAQPPGFLYEAAAIREAEAASLQGDHATAAKLYVELSGRKTATPDAVLLALGKAHQAAGDKQKAAEAFAQLYYEFPMSSLAPVAATELDGLNDLRSPRESNARFKLDLGRAERLFGSRRYEVARDAFRELAPFANGDDAEVVALRIAECDHYLRRYRQAREQLTPFLEKASRKAEARFFYLTATRELGEHDEYVRLSRELVADFPDSSWSEEALNNLASHFIIADDDGQAEAVFRELYAKFPAGSRAERAAWKAGWWAYRAGRFKDAVFYFESAASTFPRSDYRPSYLYWAGRARAEAGDTQGASGVLKVVTTDYLNTYYGRLAEERLKSAGIRLVSGAEKVAPGDASSPPPNADVVRALLQVEQYDLARDELLYALRTWGENPVTNATLAWIFNKMGDMRRGIIYMKRAYPQYMSDEGARLPVEMLRIVFPLEYWTLIKKHAAAQGLDPYLVAALINQESAFDPAIRSSANAIGLMQLLPSVGRSYARKVGIRRYSTASLTRPEVNIQLGTRYFADLVRRLDGIPFALASYNAGESRVRAWSAERPDLPLDEYIDDIPFPETQGYVRRILGTMHDYRRLYGEGTPPVGSTIKTGAAKSKPAATKKSKPAATKKSKPAAKSTKKK